LAVNLSDLAAMASEPVAGVIALTLPREGGMDLAVSMYEGLLPMAERFGVAIAGGDTNAWDGPLVISVTLVGRVGPGGALRRSGARPDDQVIVTGRFGGSILGRHLEFEPRVSEALKLATRYTLHAGIDVSDGLSIDLARMAAQSGCGVVLDTDTIPLSEDAHRLARQLADGSSALEHALADGEDFELILAVPPKDAERMLAEHPIDVPLTSIGRFVREPGLWTVDPTGRRQPLIPRGYQHEFE
jgi:thiamine-monophosphate kinase